VHFAGAARIHSHHFPGADSLSTTHNNQTRLT
jgi:hypothetical protein